MLWILYDKNGQIIKTWKPTKEKRMTINEFAVQVSKVEGKKKQVNIGQIKELLKVINGITDGELYKMIRKIVLVRV